MKKYLQIGIPMILLVLILIIGGFDGLIGVTFDGCLKREQPYCMGPSATEFLGIPINIGFILSLIFSIVVIGILLAIKIIRAKKEDISWRNLTHIFLWNFLIVLLIITLFSVWLSRNIFY